MRILIANDDGVYSPGIAALAEVAATFGEARIVAPDVERSSAGHSITASAPLRCKRTPLAGGTVEAFRAAKQAALLGLRGIALSTPSTDAEPDFAVLKPWVARVLELLIEAKDLRLVNVNLPARLPRGIKWTRQSVLKYDGKVVPGKDPMGRAHFWYTVVPLEGAEEDSDLWAIDNGFVSITPLSLDLTHHAQLERARTAFPVGDIVFG
jgi:5'-nucleotidase